VALGGKVNHHVGVVDGKDRTDRLQVGNVRLDKAIVGRPGYVLYVFQITGVGEGIQVHHLIVRVVIDQTPNNVVADEASTAGYQDCFFYLIHFLLSFCITQAQTQVQGRVKEPGRLRLITFRNTSGTIPQTRQRPGLKVFERGTHSHVPAQ